jgi:hypothetical protein
MNTKPTFDNAVLNKYLRDMQTELDRAGGTEASTRVLLDPSCGICIPILNRMTMNGIRASVALEELSYLMRGWPEYSGINGYPVKAPSDWAGWQGEVPAAYAAYWHYKTFDAMWVGEYGESRKRLLTYLIEVTSAK